jgi:glycosyltransferase involved in cell wall biosynthesis
MNILLVANYSGDRQTSMLRFAEMLHHGLRSTGHQVHVVQPPCLAGRLLPNCSPLQKWLGYADKFLLFSGILRMAVRHADLIHICDHSNSMYTHLLRGKPHLVTCHDLIGVRGALGELPGVHTGWAGRRLQKVILRGLKRVQHIVCVSQATASDVIRVAHRDARRISVIYNGLNYTYSPMAPQESIERLRTLGVDPTKPYLFHVGSNSWYKNRLGAMKIFARLVQRSAVPTEMKLIMAGKPWTMPMREFVATSGLANRIIGVAEVSNEDLRALYSSAVAFLFPSLQEGFGWPIIEAQACGCPVITTNRAPMNEVGGDACIYLDPEDPVQAAKVVARELPGLSQRRQVSLSNAARFNTSTMIRQYLDVYESLLKEPPVDQPAVDTSLYSHNYLSDYVRNAN